MSDDRPSAYYEGDLLVVRASSLGFCLWELGALLQGFEPNPWPANILRAFEEGNKAEPEVLQRLRESRWTVEDDQAQLEGELWAGKQSLVRFHPDGIGTTPGEFVLSDQNIVIEFQGNEPGTRCLIEVKALHNQSWQKLPRHGLAGLPSSYRWQVSAMMIGLGLPTMVVALNKGETPDENGVRPYHQDQGKLSMLWIGEPPESQAKITARVAKLRNLAAGGDLPNRGIECEQPDQWPCRFQQFRILPDSGRSERAEVPEVHQIDDPGDQADFDAAAKAYHEAAAASAEAEKARKAAKAELQRLAGGEVPMRSPAWELEWKPGGTHQVLDEESLEVTLAQYGHSLQQFKTAKPNAASVKVRPRS